MTPVFLLLFLAILPLEIYLLVAAGRVVGVWGVLGLLALGAFLGAQLVRWQGAAVRQKVLDSLARHEPPVVEVLHGAVLIVAGLLLIAPGLLSDAAALLALLPPVRAWLVRRLARAFLAVPQPDRRKPGPTTYEGEYRRED